MIERIKDKNIKILKALARYKFLTYSQIIRLGIFNHRSNLSNSIKFLRDGKRPFVRKIPHRIGVEAKHYLTKLGKDILCQLRPNDYNEDNVHHLKKILYTDTQDQKHRTSIIDIQIELDFACYDNKIDLLWCERYFDNMGNRRIDNNLISKTAIQYDSGASINADLTFMIKTPAQKELYLLELENGIDSPKSVEKCIKHGKAILKGTANEKYSFNQGYRTLWVFEHESTCLNTLKRIKINLFFDELKDYFLFNSLDKIKSNFWAGWVDASGEERKLYYI